jgi:hypothetical protein
MWRYELALRQPFITALLLQRADGRPAYPNMSLGFALGIMAAGSPIEQVAMLDVPLLASNVIAPL